MCVCVCVCVCVYFCVFVKSNVQFYIILISKPKDQMSFKKINYLSIKLGKKINQITAL